MVPKSHKTVLVFLMLLVCSDKLKQRRYRLNVDPSNHDEIMIIVFLHHCTTVY